MKIKKRTKYKIKQKGGWNDTTFNNFRLKVSEKNDALKQTDRWWDELKEELNFYAEEMSDRFMAEPRFRGMDMGQVQDYLDVIVLLMLDISIVYSRLLINVVNPPNPQDIIQQVNQKSIRLKDVLNIDIVEFIHILLDFVKTTDKFAESNTLGYVDPEDIDADPDDFTTTLGVVRLARKINQIQTSSYDGHYEVYKDAVLDSVKLLDVFLLKAYTGEYGELQARSIVCKDYFFDSIINKKTTIGWIKNYEDNSKKAEQLLQEFFEINRKRKIETDPSIIERYAQQAKMLRQQVEQHEKKKDELIESLNLNPGEKFLSKPKIKNTWKKLYDKLRQMTYRTPHSNIRMRNLTQGDRVLWKEYMKQWKETFRLLLYSSLVNRNDYSFFGKGLIEPGNFDKSIYKEYEQFQVKLAVFYKRLLIEWIGFSSLEEYEKADPDTYKTNKDKLRIDRRFLDIIRCIEDELDRLTDDMHPRNNVDSDEEEGESDDTDSDDDDSDDDYEMSKLPSTRHVHLYNPNLKIDLNEDSDDEFERIGSEYVNFLKGEKSSSYQDTADIFQSLKKLARENNPNNIPQKYYKNLGKIVDVKINGTNIINSLIIDVYEDWPKPIVNDTSNIIRGPDEIIQSKEYVYLIALGGVRKRNLRFGIDPDEYEFPEDDPRARRDHEEFLEVVEFDVRDPELTGFRWNGYNFEKNDIVYYISIAQLYDKNRQNYNAKKALLLEAEVLDKTIDEEDEYEDRLTHLKVEMTDSDIEQIIPVDNKQNVNLTKLGVIETAMDNLLKEQDKYEERQSYLSRTFNKFKQLNEYGEPTYHLEYSKNRRGNPKLDQRLSERGFDGMDYVKDSVEKMTDLNPDKTIDMKELQILKGKDAREKHHQNLFPERIGYLEAIMEDDKEFETSEIPKKRWEREPHGWDSEEKMEEDFDGERRLEAFLQRQRQGTSRPLQKDWYRKQRVEDEYSKFQEIPGDLVEDNPVFQDQGVNRFLKRTLRNRYRNPKLTTNLPARRMGISQKLRESFRQRRPTAREIANQTDRKVEQRTLKNRRRARELDDDILRRSRLIDGRTPVHVMNLQNRIDYRRNVPRTQSEDVVRRIDRERQRRLERFR